MKASTKPFNGSIENHFVVGAVLLTRRKILFILPPCARNAGFLAATGSHSKLKSTSGTGGRLARIYCANIAIIEVTGFDRTQLISPYETAYGKNCRRQILKS